MSTTWNAGRGTGVAEPVAEAFLRHRPAALAGDERQLAHRARGDRGGQRRQDPHSDLLAGLFRLDADPTLADVRSADARGVAAAQAGVEQEIERQALPGAERPAQLETGDLFLSPSVEAVAVVGAAEQLHAPSRVGLHIFALDREGEQAAHRLQPVVGPMRPGGPPVHTFADGTRGDRLDRLGAGDAHGVLQDA